MAWGKRGRLLFCREPHPHGGRRGAGPQPEPVGDVRAPCSSTLKDRVWPGKCVCPGPGPAVCRNLSWHGSTSAPLVRTGSACWHSHLFPARQRWQHCSAAACLACPALVRGSSAAGPAAWCRGAYQASPDEGLRAWSQAHVPGHFPCCQLDVGALLALRLRHLPCSFLLYLLRTWADTRPPMHAQVNLKERDGFVIAPFTVWPNVAQRCSAVPCLAPAWQGVACSAVVLTVACCGQVPIATSAAKLTCALPPLFPGNPAVWQAACSRRSCFSGSVLSGQSWNGVPRGL